MKTNIEIEIHEATLTNKVASVFYSITDEKGIADVKMNISKTDLMEQIKEDEMNFAYITAPDVLTELDAETFLEENLDNVIKAYLLYKFETA